MCWTCATLTLRSWQRRCLCRSTGHRRGRAVWDRKNAPFYSLLNFEEHTAHGEAFLHTSCHEVCEHSLISARTEHALGYRPAIGHGEKPREEWSMWTACLCRVVNLFILRGQAEGWEHVCRHIGTVVKIRARAKFPSVFFLLLICMTKSHFICVFKTCISVFAFLHSGKPLTNWCS